MSYCRGVKWYCPTKRDCYALIKGKITFNKRKLPAGTFLLRAECHPSRGKKAGKCFSEVLIGHKILWRNRGFDNLNKAKLQACKFAKQIKRGGR